jgi:translation initiation factor IF-2
MLEPETKQIIIGHAELRAIFKISRIGNVAGCYVLDGEVRRNAKMRVLRDEVVIFDGEVASLKHHQDDVKEMRAGFECGIMLKGFDDFEISDILECYIVEQVPL